MTFLRYVIAQSDGQALYGNYHGVSHLWEHEDGTSMFTVECDDLGFDALNADTTLTVIPSLHAPANKLGAKVQALLSKAGVTPQPGDTVLNVLRSLRNAKGLSMKIDSPF